MSKKFRKLERRVAMLEALALNNNRQEPPPAAPTPPESAQNGEIPQTGHGTDWSSPDLIRGLEEFAALALRPRRPFGRLSRCQKKSEKH